MATPGRKPTKVHATQLWQALKNPRGRKLSWRTATRMALNWLQGRPIMRRPVLLKLLYRINEEMINRLQADAALDISSPVFAMKKGTHVVLDENAQPLVRYDKDHPEIDWNDASTWPKTLMFPEAPTASTFGQTNRIEGPFQMTVHEVWDKEMDGITTLAQASDHLRTTAVSWCERYKLYIKQEHGFHGAFMKYRVERIAANVLLNMVVRLWPYILPGHYRARHYGFVRTHKDEYYRNYFYWGEGPGYNGHPCIHLPPGRPAWSPAQFVFKKRLARFLRRKNPLDPRCKPFKRIKVKIPPLSGRYTVKLGRPNIGRRYIRRVAKTLEAQAKWCFEHPLQQRLKQTEDLLRRQWTATSALRGALGGGNNAEKMIADLKNFFNEDWFEDLTKDIQKNIRRTSMKRVNLYKRQILNTIGDPIIEYGVQSGVKVLKALDPKMKWMPVFDQNNPFDQFLFQARPTSFPADFSDSDKARY